MLKRFISGQILLLCLLILNGCASLNPGEFFKSLQQNYHSKQAEKIRHEAEALLKNDKPEDAINLLQQAISDNFPETKFPALYPRAINALIKQAEYSHINSEHLKAGVLYQLALVNYPRSVELRAKTSAPPAALENRIDACAGKLLEAGLLAYRSGQLQQAIDVWTQIRKFHPTYKPSQQAIQTTRTQLQKLELLSEEPG